MRRRFIHSRRPAQHQRRGFTLMEVILAIAILAIAIAIIGELVRVGTRSAAKARDLTTAQFVCESKLAEITAGIYPPEPTPPTPYELDPEWLYSVIVEPAEQEGLLVVQVMVEQNLPAQGRPLNVTLVRWMPDPEYIAAIEAASEAAMDSTTSDTTEETSATN